MTTLPVGKVQPAESQRRNSTVGSLHPPKHLRPRWGMVALWAGLVLSTVATFVSMADGSLPRTLFWTAIALAASVSIQVHR